MRSIWFLILFGSLITYHCFTTVSGEESQPSYSQCKPYVDAALKGENQPPPTTPSTSSSSNASPEDDNSDEQQDAGVQSDQPEVPTTTTGSDEDGKADESSEEQQENVATSTEGNTNENEDDDNDSKEAGESSPEADDDSKEENKSDDDSKEENKTEEDDNDSKEETGAQKTDDDDDSKEDNTSAGTENDDTGATNTTDSAAEAGKVDDSNENDDDDSKEAPEPEENATSTTENGPDDDSGEDSKEETERDGSDTNNVANKADQSDSNESQEEQEVQETEATVTKSTESETPVTTQADNNDSNESDEKKDDDAGADSKEDGQDNDSQENSTENDDDDDSSENREPSYTPRSRQHLERILGLTGTEEAKGLSSLLDKATQTTLKELKSVYETAIKPLETLYKYRDLSNRHFGDPEIFSKPMIVFMGPWSGGKSSILNWLLGIENHDAALRTGADPSPAFFSIMTHGSEDEVLDGTQLAADWTFSGLQKFGQAFLDRLKGRKLPNPLLEKINLVEIPGILEVRKQVERSFPFNDACQWFIDRADVLFLVYDPAKLDIGPETEAILDQLKGRENQVRIVLNKADTVKPDELLRLQANLIWNISPLMASAEPPVLYVASLWGKPLNPDSPTSLLVAHENSFLKDIRDATEKREETRIAAARRFAVRVRNHAKMCDCYLNTYNNHRSFFSNKKKISDDIIEHPQNYHIYEGLSTLTNISRYDLPDPDTYRDFFRLNPLWEFPTLASTCTYFRGCPINKLDIAIAYDLPELLGRFRRTRESILSAQNQGQQQTSKSNKK